MTKTRVYEALAVHPFTRGLSHQHLADLATIARIIDFPVDSLLARERHTSDFFYLIQSGRAAIEIHTAHRGAIPVQTVGPGDVVGWSWMVPPHHWQFDVRVVDAVRTIALEGQPLRQMCEANHELGFEMLRRLIGVIAARLAATRLQLLDEHQ